MIAPEREPCSVGCDEHGHASNLPAPLLVTEGLPLERDGNAHGLAPQDARVAAFDEDLEELGGFGVLGWVGNKAGHAGDAAIDINFL